MRRNLFKKATYLLPKVRLITETDYSMRFEVISTSPHEVVIKYENYTMTLSCNCTHNAQKPNDLCSHKLAAITYLVNKPDIQMDKAIEIIETKPFESPLK